jgi:hypothetical protein
MSHGLVAGGAEKPENELTDARSLCISRDVPPTTVSGTCASHKLYWVRQARASVQGRRLRALAPSPHTLGPAHLLGSRGDTPYHVIFISGYCRLPVCWGNDAEAAWRVGTIASSDADARWGWRLSDSDLNGGEHLTHLTPQRLGLQKKKIRKRRECRPLRFVSLSLFSSPPKLARNVLSRRRAQPCGPAFLSYQTRSEILKF